MLVDAYRGKVQAIKEMRLSTHADMRDAAYI